MRSILTPWQSGNARGGVAESGTPPKARLAPAGAVPLAALFFAPATVLEPMSRNLGQTTIGDTLPALAGGLILALVVWAAAAALRRRADAAASVIAFVWVAGCLHYLEIVRHLNRALGGGYELVRPLPIALVVMVLLTIAARRWPGAMRPTHTILTGIAVVMFVTPAWKVANYERRNGASRDAYDADLADATLPPPDPVADAPRAGGAERPPDIFHFVFDRYGSEEMLAKHYGIDDPIGAFLQARGFYLARESHSNYLKTGHSLASTFAMDHLTGLAKDPRLGGRNWHPIFKMLDDHRVGRFLRNRGYEHHQYGSWWVGTFNNPLADSNRPMGFSEFNLMYLRRTVALPIFQLLPEMNFTKYLDWDNGQCQRVGRQIEEIKMLGGGARPTYVFAHVLVPHGPYVFTADGGCLSRSGAGARGKHQGFIDQIAYADVMIEDLVISLQTRDRPAVILIQADEGPFPERDSEVPWQEAPAEELRIKTGILNAYYFPSGDYSALRSDITPVNSYRLLFNTIFGTKFLPVPDRIYAFPNDNAIWELHDVTARVRCSEGAGTGAQAVEC